MRDAAVGELEAFRPGLRTVLADRFEILEVLGRGAYGQVYKAKAKDSGTLVAIKLVSLTGTSRDTLENVMGEIQLLKTLNHANVVQYEGNFQTPHHLHIILEYMELGSLSTIIKQWGPLTEELAAMYIQQVLQGLQYLQDQGVVHRDIKGANILTNKQGVVKLADFGVSTRVGELEQHRDELQKHVVGTPYWMAPEVIEMSDVITAASDIWSVGCVVIEALTGSPPYYELQPMSCLFRIVADPHPPLPPGISNQLVDFLLQCFQKDPANRPTAKSLLTHPWIVGSRQDLNKSWRAFAASGKRSGKAYQSLNSVVTRILAAEGQAQAHEKLRQEIGMAEPLLEEDEDREQQQQAEADMAALAAVQHNQKKHEADVVQFLLQQQQQQQRQQQGVAPMRLSDAGRQDSAWEDRSDRPPVLLVSDSATSAFGSGESSPSGMLALTTGSRFGIVKNGGTLLLDDSAAAAAASAGGGAVAGSWSPRRRLVLDTAEDPAESPQGGTPTLPMPPILPPPSTAGHGNPAAGSSAWSEPPLHGHQLHTGRTPGASPPQHRPMQLSQAAATTEQLHHHHQQQQQQQEQSHHHHLVGQQTPVQLPTVSYYQHTVAAMQSHTSTPHPSPPGATNSPDVAHLPTSRPPPAPTISPGRSAPQLYPPVPSTSAAAYHAPAAHVPPSQYLQAPRQSLPAAPDPVSQSQPSIISQYSAAVTHRRTSTQDSLPSSSSVQYAAPLPQSWSMGRQHTPAVVPPRARHKRTGSLPPVLSTYDQRFGTSPMTSRSQDSTASSAADAYLSRTMPTGHYHTMNLPQGHPLVQNGLGPHIPPPQYLTSSAGVSPTRSPTSTYRGPVLVPRYSPQKATSHQLLSASLQHHQPLLQDPGLGLEPRNHHHHQRSPSSDVHAVLVQRAVQRMGSLNENESDTAHMAGHGSHDSHVNPRRHTMHHTAPALVNGSYASHQQSAHYVPSPTGSDVHPIYYVHVDGSQSPAGPGCTNTQASNAMSSGSSSLSRVWEQGSNATVYDCLFHHADADHDGKVTGKDAVSFFERSGLDREVLFKVWEIAATLKNQGYLDRHAFYKAMDCIALAQMGYDVTKENFELVQAREGGFPLPTLRGFNEDGMPDGSEPSSFALRYQPGRAIAPAPFTASPSFAAAGSASWMDGPAERPLPSRVCSSIMDSLKAIYMQKLRPLEEAFKFSHFFAPMMTESDFDAKPSVLLLGQYSTGKTTFIEHLLGRAYPGSHVGPERTTEHFMVVHQGQEERRVPGEVLVLQKDLPFQGLADFGNGLLSRLEGVQCQAPLLEEVTLVDTPGIPSGESEDEEHDYSFVEVSEWLAEQCDLIFLLFDPENVDISEELKEVIRAIRNHSDKVRIVLNKLQGIGQAEVMRLYGALMWSLGKTFRTADVCRVYLGSFTSDKIDLPEVDDPISQELLEAEQEELLSALYECPQRSCQRKITHLLEQATALKLHLLIIRHLLMKLATQILFGPSTKLTQKRLLDSMPDHFSQIQRDHGIPAAKFPNPKKYKDILQFFDLSTFPKKTHTYPAMIKQVDEVINVDIPNLVKQFDNSC